jgi:hypothetical protein
MTYSEKQKLVTDTIIRLSKKFYRKDYQFQNSVGNLLKQFTPSSTKFETTCDGMFGFIQWGKDNNQEERQVLFTLLHDLGEFAMHREEDWFSPRTHRFAEFIKEPADPETGHAEYLKESGQLKSFDIK